MSQANVRQRTVTRRTHEGAPARRIDAEAQLRRALMANLLWEDSFYESGVSIAERLREKVAAVPLETAARLAIEAREEMHLRHAPLLVVREMARRGGSVVGDTLARVIQRADELAEFVALYWSKSDGGKQPLSAQVKRGLAQAFAKFDEYALAKYDRARAVRLRDVLFLCHAKPRDAAQAAVWKRLVANELTAPDTWEVALSGGADKRATWERLIAEGKLGGLALLRNLRNMAEAGVPEPVVAGAIATNEFRRVLPFRFIAAARYAPALEPALEAAMLRSLVDAPKLPGKTALLIDHSGSMDAPLSRKSEITRLDAACGLAILLREVAESVDVLAFSDWVKLVPPRHGFALRDAIHKAGRSSGTYTEMAKQAADARGYDRIVIVTDEQSHQALSAPKGGRIDAEGAVVGAAPGYVINVSIEQNGIGYGKWTHIDGWSESVVRYIQAIEGERPAGVAEG